MLVSIALPQRLLPSSLMARSLKSVSAFSLSTEDGRMAYKTDNGGFAFKSSDAKLSCGASTWATKLSQLNRFGGIVRILTYSLPDIEYVKTQFNRRPHDIFLICHSKFIDRATEIKRTFPLIRIATNPKMHSKVLLIEPHTIYISSANFGSSKWIETAIGVHSVAAHNWYAEHCFSHLWNTSTEVLP